ncbi:MAG: DUF937 domain-containing protein, partial [Gemmatimonadales bacterium]
KGPRKCHDRVLVAEIERVHAGAKGRASGAVFNHALFGGRQQTVQTGLSQTTGLDAGKVGSLLTMLAPLVMGALGRAQREGNLDERGLSTLLTGERERLNDSAPGVMGTLGRLLDRDKDGSVMDDVGGLLGKALG